MNLGEAIKKIRQQKSIRQYSLAEQCEISQTYLSQIENNVKEPNISTLRKISSALDIPLPILFFLSLRKEDVKLNRREAYNLLAPAIQSMITEFFVPTAS